MGDPTEGGPWAIWGRFVPFYPPQTLFWADMGQNHDLAVSWATWLESQVRGHCAQVQPPTFCGFHRSEWPKRTPRPEFRLFWKIDSFFDLMFFKKQN